MAARHADTANPSRARSLLALPRSEWPRVTPIRPIPDCAVTAPNKAVTYGAFACRGCHLSRRVEFFVVAGSEDAVYELPHAGWHRFGGFLQRPPRTWDSLSGLRQCATSPLCTGATLCTGLATSHRPSQGESYLCRLRLTKFASDPPHHQRFPHNGVSISPRQPFHLPEPAAVVGSGSISRGKGPRRAAARPAPRHPSRGRLAHAAQTASPPHASPSAVSHLSPPAPITA